MPGQELSEPAFSPLRLEDNSHSAWREFRILVDFYRDGKHVGKQKTGVFSPKFSLKTGISGSKFIGFADANVESDVCIINPFPQISYYSYNVWMQGEINHPGLTECALALLMACDIGWNLAAVPRHNVSNLCYSNFWAGTQALWEGYVGGVLDRIAEYLERESDSSAAKAVMGTTWHTDSAPFLPFIVERLFSTYLSLTPDLKIATYRFSDVLDFCLTDYERELVERMRPIIDAADERAVFSEDLVKIQETLCSLYVRYAREHFASNAHPHSGKTVNNSQDL